MIQAAKAAVGRRHALFLTSFFPWPLNLGARQRVFHLARGIAAENDVSVIALDSGPRAGDVEAFLANSACARVTVVPRSRKRVNGAGSTAPFSRLIGKLRSLDEHLRSPLPLLMREVWSEELVAVIAAAGRERPVDFVFAARFWMAEHARAAGVGPVILDVDDLMSVIAQQHASSSGWHRRKLIQLFDAAKDRAYERSLPTRFDRLLVAKSADRDFFAAAHRDRVSVLPNGIDLPSTPAPEPATADTILFVGALGYGPNIDAIRWFAERALPLIWTVRPSVRFIVAGFGTGDAVADVLADARCTLHESPPDLAPLYASAAVVVAPVRFGGGTRIKILEALGHGRALVATEFAAEGLDLRPGVDLEFANTEQAMASTCVALLGDAERRRALAAAGRHSVAERFDWTRIERTLSELVSRFTN